MIELRNISKIYKTGTEAVKDVTLHIKPGEFDCSDIEPEPCSNIISLEQDNHISPEQNNLDFMLKNLNIITLLVI